MIQSNAQNAEVAKDLEILHSNIVQFSKDLVAQNYEGVITAYTSDGKIFPSRRNILEGTEAISNYWMPQAGSNYRITHHKSSPVEITIHGSTAYDYGEYEGRSIGEQGTESNWNGKYVVIWKEVKPDVWKMYLDIWNQSPASSHKE